MTYLAENALPTAVVGVVLATFCFVIYIQMRSKAALKGLVVVVALTATLLIVERVVVTPREAVENSLYALAAAVEANDLTATLDHISPSAKLVRTDAETVMPRLVIEKARVVSEPQIELSPPDNPTEAVVRFQALVRATEKSRNMKGMAKDRLTVTFVRAGDRWLVKSYASERDWRREAGL